jgi:antitoxin ParD1/3/4
MATMNISLPDQMKQWVEEQVATGRYANASDYMRDLVRNDQLHVGAVAELQRLVDEGIASGISDTPLKEVIAEAKRRGREALKRKNAAA